MQRNHSPTWERYNQYNGSMVRGPGMFCHGRLCASSALAQQDPMLMHTFMITVALCGRRDEYEKPFESVSGKPSREEMAECTGQARVRRIMQLRHADQQCC